MKKQWQQFVHVIHHKLLCNEHIETMIESMYYPEHPNLSNITSYEDESWIDVFIFLAPVLCIPPLILEFAIYL